jgi:PEGA domain
MSIRRKVALQAAVLLVSILANAASLKNAVKITVLDSETRSMALNNNGVPTNCDQLTFDAYCRSTSTAPLENILLVQVGDGPPFRISCTIESRFSRCKSLPRGESYEARRENKGITVYYIDDNGKPRKQLYTLVKDGGKALPPLPSSVAAAAPPGPAPAENVGRPASVGAQAMPSPVQSSPVQPPAVSASSAPAVKVKCDFISTPPGAEISVDWRYVGSTPSQIGLSPGTHIVVISMPGFAEWKRELTVGSESQVSVAATLEKTQ